MESTESHSLKIHVFDMVLDFNGFIFENFVAFLCLEQCVFVV